jgi:hypothetical protein
VKIVENKAIGFFIMQRSMPLTVTNPMREPAGILLSGVHAALFPFMYQTVIY